MKTRQIAPKIGLAARFSPLFRPLRGLPAAIALAMACALFARAAPAQESAPPGPRYAFSTVASERIDNDWLTATLAVQVDGEDPVELAVRINRTVRAALAIVEPMAALQVQTRDYRIAPEFDAKGVRTLRWRGSQQLELQSDDVAAAMSAIEQLQATLQMQDLSFGVKPQTLSDASDRLIEQALQRFDARAALIARTVGAGAHRVIEAEISTQEARGPGPQPRMMMRSADRASSAEAAPALSGGNSLVTVNVRGHIELIQ